jgi:hypothetical protein
MWNTGRILRRGFFNPIEEALFADHGAILVVDLGDRDHRVETRRHQVGEPSENALEGPRATDGVVGRGVVAVHRYAQIERVVGAGGKTP